MTQSPLNIESGLPLLQSGLSLSLCIGARIRERRKKLGLGLMELGKKVGLSHQQLHKYERGTVSLSIERLYKISLALEIGLNYFYMDYDRAIRKNLSSLEEAPPISLKNTTPLVILIVTSDPCDEVYLRKVLKDFPTRLDIYALHNGSQALTLLKNKSSLRPYLRPDIILLESEISHINSLSLLRSLKKDEDLKIIPVIILSEGLVKHQSTEYYKNYASGFLYRSFDPDEFKEDLYTIIKYWTSVYLPPPSP